MPKRGARGGAIGGAVGTASAAPAAPPPAAPKPKKPKIDQDWARPRKQRVRERHRARMDEWRAGQPGTDPDPGTDPGGGGGGAGGGEEWGGAWGGGGAYEDTEDSDTAATEDPRAWYDYMLVKSGLNPYTGYGMGNFLDDEFMNVEANYNYLSQHVNPELTFKDYLSTLGFAEDAGAPGAAFMRRRYLSRPAEVQGYDDPRAGGARWSVYD